MTRAGARRRQRKGAGPRTESNARAQHSDSGELAYIVAGRRVPMPVILREARIAFANFLVPIEKLYRVVEPAGLAPAIALPGRGLVALSMVDYIDGELGGYGETAIAIAVRPAGAPPRSALGSMRELYGGGFGVYMHAVPVTEEWPCRAGIEIWGLPKRIGDTSFHVAGRSVTGTLICDGEPVVSMSVRGGGRLRVPEASFDTYTYGAGELRCFRSTLGGDKARIRLGGARLEVGRSHPLALELRALGLPRRALTSGYIEHARGEFGPPGQL